jgi:hypothetical protein
MLFRAKTAERFAALIALRTEGGGFPDATFFPDGEGTMKVPNSPNGESFSFKDFFVATRLSDRAQAY